MAAKLKLDEQKREQILALVRAGVHPDRAFQAAGISASTLRKWRMFAREGKPRATAFMHEIETAQAQAEANDVLTTRRAAQVEKSECVCPSCHKLVQLDPLTVLNMASHVTAVQNVKASAANIALQRLKLRFPRRWSERVIHTVEDEHNRLLDVARKVLPDDLYERLLEEYLSETEDDDAPELPPAPSSGGGGEGGEELH